MFFKSDNEVFSVFPYYVLNNVSDILHTTHNWIIVFGKADLFAFIIPKILSVLSIKISLTPLVLISVRKLSQKLALSDSLIHILRTSFNPFF